jgi:hypothetical protein
LFSKQRPEADWGTGILAAHCESFVVVIMKATEEGEIANLDEEHSSKDLTQDFSATCNPGPLCEPRPWNPYMSEPPSSNDPPPGYDGAQLCLASDPASSDDTTAQDSQWKEALQDRQQEAERQALEQPRWIWLQVCAAGLASEVTFELDRKKYMKDLAGLVHEQQAPVRQTCPGQRDGEVKVYSYTQQRN